MRTRSTPLGTFAVSFVLANASVATSFGSLLGGVAWDGSCGSTNWLSTCGGGSLTNWNDDNLPTLGTIVSIPAGSPIVSITGNAAAGLLTCETGLSISGGSLHLAGGGSVMGLHINTVTPFGIRLDGGVLSLNGGANWEYGRLTGSGTVENNALTFGRTLIMEDTTQFENFDVYETGFITLEAGCSFTNTSGGLVKLSVPTGLTQTYISGAGSFFNSGDVRFLFSGAAHTIDMACPYQQLGGSIIVEGPSTGSGMRFENDATFNAGVISVINGGNLHFRNDGGNATYVFNGLTSIAGNGNAYLAMLGTLGSDDFRIDSDVVIDMTGVAGFTMASGEPLTLNAVLSNQGHFQWSGGTIQQGSCGACSPEFRNEDSMSIFSSGVVLNSWLRNFASGTIVHAAGSINLGDSGVITNHGMFQHRGGTIQRVGGTSNGSFTNYAEYVRPNLPQTVDATIHAPFTLNPGSVAVYEKATTTYLTNGLFFNGGTAIVNSPGIVKVGIGEVEDVDAVVSGTGEFHIGGVGGTAPFAVTHKGSDCEMDLGTVGMPQGSSTAGMYLTTAGRIGGQGEVTNIGRCFWQGGGQVGNVGAGRLTNWGDVFLNGGVVSGTHAVFTNEFGDEREFGLVRQSGGLTINPGLVRNKGEWRIVAPTSIQGFGSHEFFNDQGLFLSDPGAGNTVTVSAAFNNAGLVGVNSGTLAFTGAVAQISAGGIGGRWTVVNGATLDLPGTVFIVKPDGELIIDGTWNDLNLINTNQGLMRLGRGSVANRFLNGAQLILTVPPGGEPVRVNNGSGSATNSVLGYCDHRIVPGLAGGEGDVPTALQCVNFTNAGTVRPGGPDAPGPFKIDANYISQSTAVLQIELGGTAAVDGHDQLIVDGNITLDGTLHVSVLPGFAPEAEQQFTIATASNGTIAGTFDQVTGFGSYNVAYSTNAVTLTVIVPPEPGDTNGDGVVNVTDLLRVISQWGMCPASPDFCSGDLNGNGLVNVTDLLLVIANWG